MHSLALKKHHHHHISHMVVSYVPIANLVILNSAFAFCIIRKKPRYKDRSNFSIKLSEFHVNVNPFTKCLGSLST